MRKHLYFICPTDHLECIINDKFGQENYYCTSLGNSVTFDAAMMEHVHELIEARNISEITFVLAANNRILQDAMKRRQYANVKGLRPFYRDIADQVKRSRSLWQKCDHKRAVLSLYLNKKTSELRRSLVPRLMQNISINAQVYDAQKQAFIETYSDLFSWQHNTLN